MLRSGNVRTGTAAGVSLLIAAALSVLFLASCSEPAQEVQSDGEAVVREERAAGDVVAREEPSDAVEVGVAEPNAALPRLLDLGSDSCVPCKMMAPILEELRGTYEGRLEVVFIDVWKDRGAGEEYGVRVIPTQIFFAPDGSELFRHQGFLSREDILAKWSELGYEFDDASGEE